MRCAEGEGACGFGPTWGKEKWTGPREGVSWARVEEGWASWAALLLGFGFSFPFPISFAFLFQTKLKSI